MKYSFGRRLPQGSGYLKKNLQPQVTCGTAGDQTPLLFGRSNPVEMANSLRPNAKFRLHF